MDTITYIGKYGDSRAFNIESEKEKLDSSHLNRCVYVSIYVQ
jgi:hypothetical protein